MVLQNACHIISKSLGNFNSFILSQCNTAMVIVDTTFAIKVACIYRVRSTFSVTFQINRFHRQTLTDHLDILSKSTPRLSIDSMGMRCRNHIRTSLVNLGMNHKPGFVDDRLISALADISIAVDEDQIRSLHHRKVLAKRVDPEMILEHGIYTTAVSLILFLIY